MFSTVMMRRGSRAYSLYHQFRRYVYANIKAGICIVPSRRELYGPVPAVPQDREGARA